MHPLARGTITGRSPDETTRAVVMVGGGVLSHLGLHLLQKGTPTVYGLSVDETAGLAGATLTVDGGTGRVDVIGLGGSEP